MFPPPIFVVAKKNINAARPCEGLKENPEYNGEYLRERDVPKYVDGVVSTRFEGLLPHQEKETYQAGSDQQLLVIWFISPVHGTYNLPFIGVDNPVTKYHGHPGEGSLVCGNLSVTSEGTDILSILKR